MMRTMNDQYGSENESVRDEDREAGWDDDAYEHQG